MIRVIFRKNSQRLITYNFVYTTDVYVYYCSFSFSRKFLTMSKQKSYSNEFKVKVLQEVHERKEEKFAKSAIAKKYGIPPNTLTRFIQNKEKIFEDFAKNKSGKRSIIVKKTTKND